MTCLVFIWIILFVRVCMPLDGGECTAWANVGEYGDIQACEKGFSAYVDQARYWPADSLTKGGFRVLEHLCSYKQP